jgi:mRNA interferase MazF
VVIRQGHVYWVDLGAPSGSGPGLLHPHVVVQNDLFNRSQLRTVVVCALTSRLERASAPGNVLLDEGEAGLPKRSVVNVTQLFTVDKEELVERIGALSATRLREVLGGIDLLLEPRDTD